MPAKFIPKGVSTKLVTKKASAAGSQAPNTPKVYVNFSPLTSASNLPVAKPRPSTRPNVHPTQFRG